MCFHYQKTGRRLKRVLFIKLPPIDEAKKSVGYLSTIYERSPKNIPRIGEEIWITPALSPKVVKINYSGPKFKVISLTLEPVQYSYRAFLESWSKKQKHQNSWTFDEGSRYPLIANILPNNPLTPCRISRYV